MWVPIMKQFANRPNGSSVEQIIIMIKIFYPTAWTNTRKKYKSFSIRRSNIRFVCVGGCVVRCGTMFIDELNIICTDMSCIGNLLLHSVHPVNFHLSSIIKFCLIHLWSHGHYRENKGKINLCIHLYGVHWFKMRGDFSFIHVTTGGAAEKLFLQRETNQSTKRPPN